MSAEVFGFCVTDGLKKLLISLSILPLFPFFYYFFLFDCFDGKLYGAHQVFISAKHVVYTLYTSENH